jgi:ABC-2 type transport system ATP-binding protein
VVVKGERDAYPSGVTRYDYHASRSNMEPKFLIEVIDVTKKYKTITALNNISFNVEKGEIFGFLGPNGAGKTTTLRILTGQIKPTSGKASVFGFI